MRADTFCNLIVDAAARLLDADCASLQTKVPSKPAMELVASKGLVPEAVAFWQWVDAGSSSCCGRALSRGERIIIPDVERDELLAGTEDLRHMRLCGIRAVQSTPLLSPSGEPVGMISTHWRREYQPPAETLRFLDAVALHVAALIERASAEEALRASEADLRIRVGALERIDCEKDHFLAMLAHELRSPLAPIRNSGEVLAHVLSGQPAVQRPLAILRRQTDQLTRLVDDLLDISRIQQGHLTLQEQPADIADILDQALETVQPLVREKQHTLIVERLQEPAFVLGDRARLVQCVANLLQNAAKYTQPGGQIHLQVRVSGTKLSISVSDNGPGIAPALLPRIFDPFVQGEETLERSRGGLGLGLAIVKRLVEMHGGSVEATTAADGRGSIFTIHLWRLESARLPEERESTAAAEGQARRILVVDANADAADTIAAILATAGHRVEVAYSGLSALAAAERLRPDAILLDLDLPRMSGQELARRLRARPDLQATLLIGLSGDPGDEAVASTPGLDRYLRKPIDMAELKRVLDSGVQ